MKTQEVEVRNGLKFKFSVPSDVTEYNTLSKRGDTACLDDAVDNNIYRTGLPDGWDQLAEALEQQFHIPRLTKPHPNAEKAAKGETVIGETDPAYVDRVQAVLESKEREQGVAEPLKIVARFQPIVDTFGVLDLDLTERRGRGGKLVGKIELETATAFLDAGEEKCTKALNKIAAAPGNRDADHAAIALQVKAYRTWQAEQAKKDLLS